MSTHTEVAPIKYQYISDGHVYECSNKPSDQYVQVPFWDTDSERVRTRKEDMFQDEKFANVLGIIYHNDPSALDRYVPTVSEDNPNQIAFYAEDAHKESDRRTRTRPGRFLRRIIPDVTEEDVKQFAALFPTQVTLKFAPNTNPDLWVHVYKNGPCSCMAYPEDDSVKAWYNTITDGRPTHPVRAYCHPDNDLALAYMESTSGEILARAVVNTAQQTYAQYYKKDNTYSFEDYLQAQGYEHSPYALEDQIIKRIDTDNGRIVCPYIDGSAKNVDIYHDHLRITTSGDTEPDHYTGCLTPLIYCHHCDEHTDDIHTTVDDAQLCEYCYDNIATELLDATGAIITGVTYYDLGNATTSNRIIINVRNIYDTNRAMLVNNDDIGRRFLELAEDYYGEPYYDGYYGNHATVDGLFVDTRYTEVFRYMDTDTYVTHTALNNHPLQYLDDGSVWPIDQIAVLDGQLVFRSALPSEATETNDDPDYPNLPAFTTQIQLPLEQTA